MDVIGYGDPVVTKGLNMLYGPGNDLVSATAMTAAGAHLILFSTGRGTPFSAPAPTLKISTNTPLAQKKSGWIDFNTGVIADGERPSTRPPATCWIWSSALQAVSRPRPRSTASARSPSSKMALFFN